MPGSMEHLARIAEEGAVQESGEAEEDGQHVEHPTAVMFQPGLLSLSQAGNDMAADPNAVQFFDSTSPVSFAAGFTMGSAFAPGAVGPLAGGGAAPGVGDGSISWFGFDELQNAVPSPPRAAKAEGGGKGRSDKKLLGVKEGGKSLLDKLRRNFLSGRSGSKGSEGELLGPTGHQMGHSRSHSDGSLPSPKPSAAAAARSQSPAAFQSPLSSTSADEKTRIPQTQSSQPRSVGSSYSGPLVAPSFSGPLQKYRQSHANSSGPLPTQWSSRSERCSMSGPLGPAPTGQTFALNSAQQAPQDVQTLIGIAPGASPAALEAYLKAKAARQARAGKRVIKVVEVSMK